MAAAPEAFYCPITRAIMNEPVFDSDGNTFEKKDIIKWITQHGQSPITRQPMTVDILIPNRALKDLIDNYLGMNQMVTTLPVGGGSAPKPFYCPISHTIMNEPVFDSDGNTFEKKDIIKWITQHGQSPITRQPMTVDILIPNRALKDLIDNYLGMNQMVTTLPVGGGSAPQEIERDPVSIIAMIDVSGSMQEICKNGNSAEQINFTRLDLVKHTMSTIITSLNGNDKLGIIKFNDEAKLLTGLIPVTDDNKQVFTQTVNELTPSGNTNIWAALRLAIDLANNNNTGSKIHILLFTDGESNCDPPRGIIPTLKEHLQAHDVNISISTFGFGYQINSNLLFELSNIKQGIFGFIPDSTMIGTVFINSLAHFMTYSSSPAQLGELENKLCDVLVEKLKIGKLDDFNVLAGQHAGNSFVDSLLQDTIDSINDSDGQINKALQSRFYNVWGRHYILSVISAYLNRFCLNFRDHGVQHFKTEKFNQVQKIIEDVFMELTPPTPTGRCSGGSNAPVRPEVFRDTFYSSSGVCFLTDTKIKVEGGNFIPVQNVTKGTKIESFGKTASVICVLKTKLTGIMRRNFNDPTTVVTQYHPVFFNKQNDPEWVFPTDSSNFQNELFTDVYVYDYVLDNHHIVELGGGVFATTLNHGRQGEVIGHDYFGTEKVIDDLKKHSGWESGFIQLDNYMFIRDHVTTKIVGLFF